MTPRAGHPVLIAAPTRRDAEVTFRLLTQAGIDALVCSDLGRLAAEVELGVGAIVLTDAALSDPAFDGVLAALDAQPPWSDVPAVLLASARDASQHTADALGALGNVTLLDRPCSTRSVVSAVQSALRGRRRQFQLRDQLRQQDIDKAALREADLRKNEFLATLAHELRNPLAAISTGTQVLARGAPDAARLAQIAGMMDRQTRLLVKLIDDLLDVSRIVTGKVVLKRQRIDLRGVVEAALETLKPQVDAAQHSLAVTLPPAPVWVQGDAARLAQVAGNLISNAAKYTPRQGRIAVELQQADGQAVLTVSDNGFGIAAGMLPQVFEMFTQGHRTLGLSQGGLGIGLSLVRRLMDLHGGSVLAHSAGVGQGSRFTVTLPLADTEAAAAGDRDNDNDNDADDGGGIDRAGNGNTRALRILVIDDNTDVADTLSLLLNHEGHRLRTEYSGSAGLDAAADFQPDVVFCDLGMPGVDGHQVTARLRAQRRHAATLLVALTGWSSDDVRRRARLAGFDIHITKPLSAEAVTRLLASV